MAAQYWGKKTRLPLRRSCDCTAHQSHIQRCVHRVCGGGTRGAHAHFYVRSCVIESGAVYLRAVSLSYLLCVFHRLPDFAEKYGYATVSSRISCTAVVVNIICNAILIYGLLGLPALGIQGAAYATVAARLVELIWSYLETKQSGRVQIIWKKMFHAADAVLTKDFWRYTTPVLGAALVWGIAMCPTL